ncbi:O-acetyl-ADP-ribose deacetylase [Arthrobacter sp. 35W]|uniref:O-acetyl-ADP-ribose deacetylase n=1 Tax=Arthrobacter sp. 35W TaxID=1132441 RepID=UPI0003FAFA15|nr:O-acetyl-ADP-ribose deacetylase [Arthrobacter sp. 35W]
MDITVLRGDITTLSVDAIVNAANSSLLGGGGVDGAIHAAAGPTLLAQCRELRRLAYPFGLPVGDAAATGAGRLDAQWVVHTVGPNRHAGENDAALLRSCFLRSCEVASGLGATSIAFPAIGAGVYGWSAADVAQAAAEALAEFAAAQDADQSGGGIETVLLVAFSPELEQAFRGALSKQFGGGPSEDRGEASGQGF